MLDIRKLCEGINCKSEPKINEEAKQLSLVLQEKIPQSSQIIYELGIKREAIVLYHTVLCLSVFINIYVCVQCVCLCVHVFMSEEEIPASAQGCRHSL